MWFGDGWSFRVENGNGNGSNEVGEERWWEMGMVPGCEIRKLKKKKKFILP